MVTMRSPSSLTIGFDGAMSATSYRVMWRSESALGNMTVNDTTATITNLHPGSPYNISVVAINEAGESVRTKLTNELTSTYNY